LNGSSFRIHPLIPVSTLTNNHDKPFNTTMGTGI
jgi:hypothetical protein